MLTKLDLMDKGTNALDVCVCGLLFSVTFLFLLPLGSVISPASLFPIRFLKEELTDCSIPGLEL